MGNAFSLKARNFAEEIHSYEKKPPTLIGFNDMRNPDVLNKAEVQHVNRNSLIMRKGDTRKEKLYKGQLAGLVR